MRNSRGLLLPAAVLVAMAVVGGLALTGFALAPGGETEGTAGPAARAIAPGASPTRGPVAPESSLLDASLPVAVSPAAAPSQPARPSTSAPSAEPLRTITGALTILSSGSEAAVGDLIGPGSSPAAGPPRPWKFVRGELDALLARQETEDLDPLELRAAYETIGCLGAGEFRAFTPGRTVDVRDERGRVIASGVLETGSTAGLDPGSGCRLPFTVAGVPPAVAYTIDVGGATLSYTETQLDERGWNVELRIGSSE